MSRDWVEFADNGCWIWIRGVDSGGYARAQMRLHGWKLTLRAARAVYKAMVGPIPEGWTLDHLCHTRDEACAGGPGCLHRRCVNPAHLEPVTRGEKVRRGRGPQVVYARLRAQTHCKNGHELSTDNTYVPPNGSRQCRTCQRARGRAYDQTRRRRQRAG